MPATRLRRDGSTSPALGAVEGSTHGLFANVWIPRARTSREGLSNATGSVVVMYLGTDLAWPWLGHTLPLPGNVYRTPNLWAPRLARTVRSMQRNRTSRGRERNSKSPRSRLPNQQYRHCLAPLYQQGCNQVHSRIRQVRTSSSVHSWLATNALRAAAWYCLPPSSSNCCSC